MIRTNSILLAGGTLLCALGIGYVMQYGLALPGDDHPVGPVEVTDIQDIAGTAATQAPAVASALPGSPASHATPAAYLPVDAMPAPDLPSPQTASVARDMPSGNAPLPKDITGAAAECGPHLTATPLAGALVRLDLDAPCNAEERVTLHHNGLMVTEVTDADGALSIDIPALSERAVFIAAFGEGRGAVAKTEVAALPLYDRIVLQWQDSSGLELHAREWGARYFGEGHVWHGAAGGLEAAVHGEGGFLLRLGHDSTAAPRLAEIYSFPAGTAARDGAVGLSVEAEVTEANCGKDVSAQVIELRGGGRPALRDLTLSIPGCEAVGDYLVLKNLIQDLKIASN